MGHWLTRSGQIEPCVYRPGTPSRYEIMIPTQRMTPPEVDTLHAQGARRSGWLFYQTACPTCDRCQPLRIDLATFARSRSQRRVWRANQDLIVEVDSPRTSAEHVALYNKHLFERGLNTDQERITEALYDRWLVQSGIQTLEFRYRLDEQLVGVGLVDRGEQDASSVYFYFDPEQAKRSLGVFSMLTELEWLKSNGLRYHYLGFYNEDCKALRYKAAFGPHQLLTRGGEGDRWTQAGDPEPLR